MTGADPTNSNRLQASQERLARAIGRLEAAVEHRAESAPMSQDDANLLAQAQELQTENAKLRALVDETAARLDGTIAKFKNQLAEQV
ncbi:hypothetical protein [Magnetovibrio sp.]|uniref:hypothetical protein n=1 Tax=Magnetovibrio sp. TaxID=2024836 RepID=UPI002F926677